MRIPASEPAERELDLGDASPELLFGPVAVAVAEEVRLVLAATVDKPGDVGSSVLGVIDGDVDVVES